MLCCIRRTKPVEKNEEADLKIEQDGNKPEDKAHKAATKIQASFRGHIIRKKLKVDKKEDSPIIQDGATDGEEKKEKASPVTESAPEPANDIRAATNEAKSPEKEKAVNSPTAAVASPPAASEPGKGEAEPEKAAEAKDNSKEVEEKAVPASENKESTPTANVCAESATSATAAEGEDKEEPKQADVPAANDSETTPNKAQSEGTESAQPEGKVAAEESKPIESTLQVEAGKDEENDNQDKV